MPWESCAPLPPILKLTPRQRRGIRPSFRGAKGGTSNALVREALIEEQEYGQGNIFRIL